jgi:hypothetical protein
MVLGLSDRGKRALKFLSKLCRIVIKGKNISFMNGKSTSPENVLPRIRVIGGNTLVFHRYVIYVSIDV